MSILLQLLHGLRRATTLNRISERSSQKRLLERARLLRKICRDLLHHLRLEVQTEGNCPEKGLLVSNHVSFLDILVLSSVSPMVFISKSEVAGWPIVGPIASCAGTLFVNREKRGDVSRINGQIQGLFDEGLLLCLFPEGTSSDGKHVLPFKPSLLQPALSSGIPIFPAHISYSDENGGHLDSVAYYGDRNLAECLTALLWRKLTRTRICFGRAAPLTDNRKEAAVLLHAEISRMTPWPTPCVP